MATITEDYVSFEIAKLLKEKGFDEDCWCWYEEDGFFRESNDDFGFQSNSWHVVDDDEFTCSAPTLQMAMKWLREKNIIIVVRPEYFNAESKCSVWNYDIRVGDNYTEDQGDFYSSYEQTCEAAIKYCLENLI